MNYENFNGGCYMSATLTVQIFSFGYHRSGIPYDNTGNKGGFVFDCRHLPNPGRYEQYRHVTGQNSEVIAYLKQFPIVDAFLSDIEKMIDRAIEAYHEMNYTDLMVSFGCTGGQHRSIYCAEHLNHYLASKGINTILRHTELPEIKMRAKMAQAKIPSTAEKTNAGVTSAAIRFCDLKCPDAAFPEDEAIDGAKSCRTFAALWCKKLNEYVTKNAPCSWQHGKRRPKAGW